MVGNIAIALGVIGFVISVWQNGYHYGFKHGRVDATDLDTTGLH
jgi:hypothetical protein